MARAAPDAAVFAPDAEGTVATMATAAGPISLRHPDAAAVPARADGDQATFDKALGAKRDLVLTATADGYKEEVVLADASAGNSYVEEFEFPEGVTARDAEAGIDFVDAEGTIVATLAGGVAYDASFPAAGPTATTPVSVRVVPASDTPTPTTTTESGEAEAGTADEETAGARAESPAVAGNIATVEVSISAEWLAAKERKAPITIDPSMYVGNAFNHFDTYVTTAAPTSNFSTSPFVIVGSSDGFNTNRGLFFFNLGSTPVGPGVQVVSADLSLYSVYAPSCTPRSLHLWGLSTPPTITDTVTWNTQPPLDAVTGAIVAAPSAKGATGCAEGYVSLDATRLARRWLTESAPNLGIGVFSPPPETNVADYRVFHSAQAAGAAHAPILTITYNRLPTASVPTSPDDGVVLVNNTPTLTATSATDPDGDAVKYWFRVGAGPDVEGGYGIESGWIDSPTWTVPPGALVDGLYRWHVFTWDGVSDGSFTVPALTSKRTLRITRRLGAGVPAPTDAIGPVQANLASGNVVTAHAGPRFPTVGGDLGVSLAYNSAAATNGLQGEYFPDSGAHQFVGNPALSRLDPSVAFYWGTTSGPGPTLGTDNFMARWTGKITVPSTGTYTFYAATTDGVRIYLNGSTTPNVDGWVDSGGMTNRVVMGSPVVVNGTTVPTTMDIRVEYFEASGPAGVTLAVLAPAGNLIVPPSWLTAAGAGPMPPGWTLSGGFAPALAYTSARISEHGVTLTDAGGGLHTYAATPGGGYTPPSDEDGVLGRDGDGLLTLIATDGLTYVFDVYGNLTAATSALDDSAQASPSYTWNTFGGLSRMEMISDPVGVRQIILRYQNFNPSRGCDNPPSGQGLAVAPAGKLCRVDYWDGRFTRLWYNTNGQLTRISEDPPGSNLLDPAAAITDYTYNSERRLAKVREPLANDAMRVPALTNVPTDPNNDATTTVVTYDGAGRVTHISLPVPYDGSVGVQKPRPGRGYVYVDAITTRVRVDGLVGAIDEPKGFNRQVTFDLAGRIATSTDGDTGVGSAGFAWDEGDRPVVQTDPAGRSTTTIYDGDATRAQRTGRISDTYGPAPAACFGADNRPNGSCAVPPPHSHTDFDAPGDVPATGLARVSWTDAGFRGPPSGRGEAAGPDASGRLLNGPFNGGSARFSGEVSLTATGTYGYGVTATGASARVFVDDTLVADTATGGSGVLSNAVVGRHRFRVDVAGIGSTPVVTLTVTPPGGVARALVAADLAPRWANPTRTTIDDNLGVPARVGTTTYENLANGLITQERVDPGASPHLDLVTTTSYEAAGFRRSSARTLPANNPGNPDAATSYDYYGNTEAGPAACGQSAGVSQAGRARTTKAPGPAGTSANRRATTVVYDAAGRVIASRIGSEAYICTGYDIRGRVISHSTPAFGGEPAHSYTYTYALANNPFVTQVAEGATTMTTKTDLLGRVLSYTDSWGKITTPTYDNAGRLTDTSGPAGAMHMVLSPAGRVTSQSLDGSAVAQAIYDGGGELASVSYPSGLLAGGNGSALASVERHPTGAVTRLRWTAAQGAALADDIVGRSQSGKVIDESIDGADANPAGANFAYDAAGRLTQGRVAGHVLDYAFDATGGCGAQAAAGRNTNRTRTIDNGGTPVTYCYNQADQLTSSSDPGVGTVTYDAHGNTATIGNQTLLYDGGDRHMATKVGGVEVVRYTRDATGRITSRTEGATTTRYGFTGPGDSASFTMDTSNNVTERTIGLVGGVLLTKRPVLGLPVNDVWSYPNVHGDTVATANSSGTKQATFSYDPFGKLLGSIPDNSAGNFDYGWLGQRQRPLEHAGSLATIEMGARQYLPSIGRFLEVDPVEAGSTNDYDYSNADPVNAEDCSGNSPTNFPSTNPTDCDGVLRAGNYACAQVKVWCEKPGISQLVHAATGQSCDAIYLECLAAVTLIYAACKAAGGWGSPPSSPGRGPDVGPVGGWGGRIRGPGRRPPTPRGPRRTPLVPLAPANPLLG